MIVRSGKEVLLRGKTKHLLVALGGGGPESVDATGLQRLLTHDLIKGAHFPFLTLVSMRGDFGEGNPWQFPMGQATQPALEAMGVEFLERATEIDQILTIPSAGSNNAGSDG